eukprot:TRINITY_DN77851_c0_g1_i1.p2 TRINITY_DN77851_c0_g1~~TRINITY_DN77851_c0_g1_i1.p2  ORF type:complete len:179 (-),score=75.39 TRINITY_DN77851_c0_g1_i1:40-576(-)
MSAKWRACLAALVAATLHSETTAARLGLDEDAAQGAESESALGVASMIQAVSSSLDADESKEHTVNIVEQYAHRYESALGLGSDMDTAEQKLQEAHKEFVDNIIEETAKYKAEARACKQEAEDAKHEELLKMEDECRKRGQEEADKREEMTQKMRHENDEMQRLMNQLGRVPNIINNE